MQGRGIVGEPRLRAHGANRAVLPRKLAAGREGLEQQVARVVVDHGIDEEALARAGDAREHLARRGLRDAFGVGAGHGRERQQVLLAPAIGRARPRHA